MYQHAYVGEVGWKFGDDEIEEIGYLAQEKLVPRQSLQPLKIILAELVCIVFYLLCYFQQMVLKRIYFVSIYFLLRFYLEFLRFHHIILILILGAQRLLDVRLRNHILRRLNFNFLRQT